MIARVAPGTNRAQVRDLIAAWGDVTVYTKGGQEDLLLQGMVDKARRQLGMFRTLLTIIAAVIMALILYTLTLDKLHSIALLKLLGAPDRTILGMLLQQAIALGVTGYAIALAMGRQLFPYFPRRVVDHERRPAPTVVDCVRDLRPLQSVGDLAGDARATHRSVDGIAVYERTFGYRDSQTQQGLWQRTHRSRGLASGDAPGSQGQGRAAGAQWVGQIDPADDYRTGHHSDLGAGLDQRTTGGRWLTRQNGPAYLSPPPHWLCLSEGESDSFPVGN